MGQTEIFSEASRSHGGLTPHLFSYLKSSSGSQKEISQKKASKLENTLRVKVPDQKSQQSSVLKASNKGYSSLKKKDEFIMPFEVQPAINQIQSKATVEGGAGLESARSSILAG